MTKPNLEISETSPRVIVDRRVCKACGLCIVFCPRKVLRKGSDVNGLGYHATEYLGNGCSGCATCYVVCPEPGALTVYRRERGDAPKRETGGAA